MFIYFSLIFSLYFSILEVNAHISNPPAELTIPILLRTKETKAEIKISPVIAEAKISNCSI